MTHIRNSKKDLERIAVHCLKPFSILNSPLTSRLARTLEFKVEKLEAVSLLVAFLRLRL